MMFRVTSFKGMALITASILCLAGISFAARLERHFKTLTLLRDTKRGETDTAWKHLQIECGDAYYRPTIDLFQVGDISNTYVGTFAMTNFFMTSLNDTITFENVTLSYNDTRRKNVKKLLAKEGFIKVMLHNVASDANGHEPHTADGGDDPRFYPITCLVGSVGEETTRIHEVIRNLQKQKGAIGEGMTAFSIGETGLGELALIQTSIRTHQDLAERARHFRHKADKGAIECSRESIKMLEELEQIIVDLQKKEKELTDKLRGIDAHLDFLRKLLL